jgi:hypothetical protein
VEHTDAAQLAALLGALGAVLVLLARDRFLPLAGLALLGLATAALGRSLVGDETLRLLVTEPTGLALLGAGAAAVVLAAVPLARFPAVVPVVLLAVAPFRVPVELGDEEAFLLLPLYFVIAAAALALGYRMLRGERPPAPPLLLGLPLAALVGFASVSFLWTWDERGGGIALAFFLFPFTAALATVARAPVAPWLPRALLVTLAALGTLFAGVGIWQAQTRTLFFARDVEVANAYTSFFQVTSLFKDPSVYGRSLVIPIVVLLVALLFRRSRPLELALVAGLVAFLFSGLYYSYSQSSFLALFVVTLGVSLVWAGRRLRIALVAAVLAAMVPAVGYAVETVEGRSVRDVTDGRSRLVEVTVDAFRAAPLAGVGIGGQPRASTEESGRGSPRRNASHTTPLTVLAELGVAGFALYAWVLGAAAWACYLVAARRRALGFALGGVLLALATHSVFYAGFFEDPVTWGALALAAAALSALRPRAAAAPAPRSPQLLAH